MWFAYSHSDGWNDHGSATVRNEWDASHRHRLIMMDPARSRPSKRSDDGYLDDLEPSEVLDLGLTTATTAAVKLPGSLVRSTLVVGLATPFLSASIIRFFIVFATATTIIRFFQPPRYGDQ